MPNVGIGTTAPSALLNLAAGSTTNAPLKLTSSAGALLSTPQDGAIEYDGTNYYVTIGSTRNVIATGGTSGGSLSSVTSISDSSGNISLNPNSSTGSVDITSTTTSSSSSTGALVVSGGEGVAGALNVGGAIASSGAISSSSSITAGTDLITPQIYGSTAAAGNIKIDGTSSTTVGNVLLAPAGGNVGIGTTSPSTKLQVAGEISPSADNTYTLGDSSLRFSTVYAANGVVTTSDERQKRDIQNSDLGLDFINKLRAVSYKWKSGADTTDTHYGLIAQETEKTVKEAKKLSATQSAPIVDYDKKTDRYGLRYTELISPLIKAIQELYNKFLGHDEQLATQAREIASVKAEADTKADKTETDALKAENAQLKAKNQELEQRLEKIEKALNSK